MQVPPVNSEIFVVIPAFNEQKVLRSVVAQVLSFQYSVVVVDDGSAEPLSSVLQDMNLYLLRHRVNLGQGAALQTGIEFALEKKARYIVTFDADGQHDAGDIAQLLAPLIAEEADVVTGSRFMTGSKHNMPARRVPMLQLARYLNYFFTGLLLTDAHNGLRALTRIAASKIVLKENGMAHATEWLSQIKSNKLSYREIPVNIHYSDYSREKGQTIWSSFRIFFDLLLNKIFK